MSFYQEIIAVSPPFEVGFDENERKMFSMNFDCMVTAPATDFVREIGRLINDASLGTFGTDMFIGMEAILPTGDGPYITIINTGGSESLDTHNVAQGVTYEMRSCQIVVRARTYDSANTRALAVWRVLDGIRNTTVVA